MLDKICLSLLIIGGLNWGSIGLFQFDLVAWVFGGQDALLSRIVYILVGIAGLICITLYKKILETGKAKYAYEIVQLAREIADK